MNLVDWYSLKDKVYYWDDDGFERWRDIYILQTTKEDWNNWIDVVNQEYPVKFYNGLTQQNAPAIDKRVIFDYQERKTDCMSSAVIKVGQVNVNCRFFSLSQIENDIDPREVKTVEDHEGLMVYLKAVSKKLKKPVVLTEENEPNLVYISVDNDDIRFKLE